MTNLDDFLGPSPIATAIKSSLSEAGCCTDKVSLSNPLSLGHTVKISLTYAPIIPKSIKIFPETVEPHAWGIIRDDGQGHIIWHDNPRNLGWINYETGEIIIRAGEVLEGLQYFSCIYRKKETKNNWKDILEDLGFRAEDTVSREIDPDKIYILTVPPEAGPTLIEKMIDRVSPLFHEGRGEMLVITSEVGLAETTLDDLKIIHQNIGRMIAAVERKEEGRNRYEILRLQSSQE